VVTKNDGKVINSVTETVSEDGNTLTMKGKNTKPDGSSSDYEVATKRVGSGSGFAGTWESTNVKINSPEECRSNVSTQTDSPSLLLRIGTPSA
jgi:hypothetical protein